MKRFRMLRDRRGAVTVPVAILLASVCLLNLVLLDYTRFLSFRERARDRVCRADRSILASFDSLLASRYGLYGVNRVRAYDFEDRFQSYLSGSGLNGALDFLDFTPHEASASLQRALSQPDTLKEQIVAQMRYRTPVRGAKWLLSRIQEAGNASGYTDAALLLAKGSAVSQKAEAGWQKLKNLLEGYFNGDHLCVNGFTAAVRLFWEKETLLAEMSPDLKNASVLESVVNAHRELQALYTVYYNYNMDAIEQIRALQAVRNEMETILDEAEKKSGKLDEAERGDLEAMLRKMRRLAARIGNETNLKKLTENVALLQDHQQEISENLTALTDFFTHPDGTFSVSDFTRRLQKIFRCQAYYDEFSVGSLSESANPDYVAYDTRGATAADIGIFESDTFVIPDVVYRSLPSVQSADRGKTEAFRPDFLNVNGISELLATPFLQTDWSDIGKEMTDDLLVQDYIMAYLNNRMNAGKSAYFRAEVEYILCGKAASSENLKTVSERLLALRFILNFAHLLRSEEKRAFAEEVGRAIALAVSGGVGGTCYAALLMGAWAFAESCADVTLLLKGENVPIVKRETDWNTSIKGLSQAVSGPDKGEDTENLSDADYGDYLMLLLLLEKPQTKLLRIADVIEVNMTDLTGERYFLSGVFTAICGTVRFEPDYISFLLRPVKRKEAYWIDVSCTETY